MHNSEQINEIAAALAKAQAEMKNASLNKTNPHFRNKYADLAAIRDTTIPALSKNGLAITQATGWIDGELFLISMLMHTSGQWIKSAYPLPVVLDKPQVMGSALTYAKRYSWAALCGIAAEEDDDAEAASAPRGATKEAAAAKKEVTFTYSEEDSQRYAEAMVAQIAELPTVEDVADYAKQNAAMYQRCLRPHQTMISEALSQRKAALAKQE